MKEFETLEKPSLIYYTIGLSKEGKEIKLFRTTRMIKRRCE